MRAAWSRLGNGTREVGLRYILEEQPRGLADGLELDEGGVKNEDAMFCWWQPWAGWQTQRLPAPLPQPHLALHPWGCKEIIYPSSLR